MAVFLRPIQGHERRYTGRPRRTASSLTEPIKSHHGALRRENKYKKVGLRAMLSPPRLPALYVTFDAVTRATKSSASTGVAQKLIFLEKMHLHAKKCNLLWLFNVLINQT